ncbi:MAG: MBL fold metallo-hydrolase [Lachnospiraceae bacterium]|nr:MBL fold metallo-hydrolase [Lachnospiraceae bacterium]
MKITWLGQAGLLFETGEMKILVDPYLSDAVGEKDPAKHRKVPVDERFFGVEPDVIVLTHNHLDHTDPETLSHYLCGEKSVTVLASGLAWEAVRVFGGSHNYVLFNRHTEFTVGSVRFRAVKAEHSDLHAVGVLIEAEDKTYYLTGDTLYNTEIFPDLPEKIDVVFLPVNGAGNNMNMADAKRFCKKIRAKIAVPVHCGMFDDIDMTAFACKNAVIPTVYEEIPLP